jgi:hypothetical protein
MPGSELISLIDKNIRRVNLRIQQNSLFLKITFKQCIFFEFVRGYAVLIVQLSITSDNTRF